MIISTCTSNYGGQILCRGTEEGRKIYKHLQMKLPSKIKYTNICKDVFPVLYIFTFVNTCFCRFLQSLKMVWRVTSNFSFFKVHLSLQFFVYLCNLTKNRSVFNLKIGSLKSWFSFVTLLRVIPFLLIFDPVIRHDINRRRKK